MGAAGSRSHRRSPPPERCTARRRRRNPRRPPCRPLQRRGRERRRRSRSHRAAAPARCTGRDLWKPRSPRRPPCGPPSSARLWVNPAAIAVTPLSRPGRRCTAGVGEAHAAPCSHAAACFSARLWATRAIAVTSLETARHGAMAEVAAGPQPQASGPSSLKARLRIAAATPSPRSGPGGRRIGGRGEDRQPQATTVPVAVACAAPAGNRIAKPRPNPRPEPLVRTASSEDLPRHRGAHKASPCLHEGPVGKSSWEDRHSRRPPRWV